MNIYETFEQLSLNRDIVEQHHIYQLSNTLDDKNLITVAERWITGIESNHQVPARVAETIAGIVDWYRECEMITDRQRIYLVANIMNHWDQLSLSARIEMNL
jgi:hypothetical protein